MKELAQIEIEKLLEIISPAPLLRIGHFSDQGTVIPHAIDHFCAAQGYEYLLNCTSESYLQSVLADTYTDACTAKHFPLERPNYMQHGKFYDYLFVSAQIREGARVEFLKKTHRVIKNAGLILLFLPRDDRAAPAAWQTLLEEHYFVATSMIDLDAQWRVIISKKMHGWGG